ncbi:MAG: hypothetical protein ACFCU7_10470 [Pleurocapsa sp.]
MVIYYIQSRGKNQDEDYRWLRIKPNEYYPENPDFLLQPISNLSIKPIDLIESQKFSIILVARRNDYCLLVTGLKAREERMDFMGRPVRNSILWICRKDGENIKIRSLLILALRGELDRVIDETINISGKYGFEVDYDRLKHLSNSTLAIGNNYQTDASCKIGKNCDSLREEIALELESNVLPEREGLLVLVTSIKSASTLKDTGVWRGLSNRVEFHEFKQYASLDVTKFETEKKTIWLLIAIAVISTIAISFLIIKLTIWQKPQPKINPNSPNLQESTLLEEKSRNSSKKALTSIELSTCQNQKEIDYFLSPCSLNVKNN